MVIPRKATQLKVTFKVDTSHHKLGDTVIVNKTNCGWSDSRCQYFISMLRNDNICSIEIIK